MAKSAVLPTSEPLQLRSAQNIKEEKTNIQGDEDGVYTVSRQKLKETIEGKKEVNVNPEDNAETEQIGEKCKKIHSVHFETRKEIAGPIFDV